MLNPISTITVESALVPATSGPETATPDLFRTLIAELLEPTQAPDTPPAPQPVANDLRSGDIHEDPPAKAGGWQNVAAPGLDADALGAISQTDVIQSPTLPQIRPTPWIMPEFPELVSTLPQPQVVPEATQLVTDAPILLPLMEVTSIKIETEPLNAPTAHVKLDPTPVQSEPVPKQPITIAPEAFMKGSAAAGNTTQFAQSGSQEKQDFRNECGHAPFVETRSITPHLENPVRFQSHLMPMASPAPVAHVVEQPPQLPLPVAHRVSIDIGEKDSRVVVTLHENRGDISVKIHAPNQILGAELRTSAGTLVEAFHREHIPLANMDFTSGYTATSDDRQQHGSQPRQSFHNRARKIESAAAPTDQVEITSINLNAQQKTIKASARSADRLKESPSASPLS